MPKSPRSPPVNTEPEGGRRIGRGAYSSSGLLELPNPIQYSAQAIDRCHSHFFPGRGGNRLGHKTVGAVDPGVDRFGASLDRDLLQLFLFFRRLRQSGLEVFYQALLRILNAFSRRDGGSV